VALAPPSPDVLDFVARVAHAYAKLIASPFADPESGLGGRLFYAGELDEQGRALFVAANIAGAATLVASADLATQKQAIREAIADFLVTSLDEALRILKNQLRKRETVSVCVAMAPAAMEREMNERGVEPDLLRRDVPTTPLHKALIDWDGEQGEANLTSVPALVIWHVDSARHKDLAVLDAIALECLDANDWPARRWLRLAPRYLGRLAQDLRLLSTHREFAARFFERLKERVDRGEIAFSYEILSYVRGLEEKHRSEPGEHPAPVVP
jgi:Urocanase Rossmann-like domain